MTPATMGAAVVFMVVAFLGVYYLLLYSPLSDELVRESGRRSQVRQQLRDAQTEQTQYQADLDSLERSRSHARDLQRILPDNPDIPGFMRSINTLAESSGLQIALIQPDDEVVEQYFVRVPVRLEVSGSYLALARFFRAVSQLPRVINMENIALEEPHEENGEVHLHARVLATTFRSVSAAEQAAQAAASTNRPGGATPSGVRR
jgi:type IV pilus assembly protein PilO